MNEWDFGEIGISMMHFEENNTTKDTLFDFQSSCVVKTCFRAIDIRQNFIFSDILSESQRRAYDKGCNM